MGRKWQRRSKNKHQKGRDGDNKRKQGDPSKYGQERNPYKMIESGNFKMESYYAYQGIHDYRLVSKADAEGGTKAVYAACTTFEEKEEERQKWLTSMKTILPSSFRIGNDLDEALRDRLIHELDEFVGKPMEILFEPKGGDRRTKELDLKPEMKTIAPAIKFPFIPNAYQLSLDRQTIRRNAGLNEFHEWLKIQTHAGFITRQETVSMLPPVVLDVKPHHKVLDMCAAPGSKTSQLLEVVNQKPDDGGSYTEPVGCVVANDSDNKRAYMLVHQLRRINSPAVLITNCDARFFPLTTYKPRPDQSSGGAPTNNETDPHPTVKVPVEFDRVLCDVPCSGDGTARKNPGVWKKWNQLNAFGLHVIQLAIAVRGARLTRFDPEDKDPGYLCYSTCSMNPIENEAVVAALLRASEGSLELVDVSLPGLTCRPGVSTWKVLCEEKSKRQMKDFANKNNPKMIARRKAWEEKRKAEEEAKAIEGGLEGDSKIGIEAEESKPSGEDDKEKSNSTANAESADVKEEAKEEVIEEQAAANDEDEKMSVVEQPKEEEEEVKRGRKQFEPKKMDEDELKECCDSAGLQEYTTYEEVPIKLRRRLRESSFPPTREEAAKFRLDRCLRVLPQDMDTGGFFVSLLKKVAPMSSKAQANLDNLTKELKEAGKDEEGDEEPKAKRAKVDDDEEKADVEKETDATDVAPEENLAVESPEEDTKPPPANAADGDKEMVRGVVKQRYLRGKDGKVSKDIGNDDFVPIPSNIFDPLIEYYGLSASSFDRNQYRIRACSDAKVLYFIGNPVKNLIDQGLQERLTVINTGLKSFARNNKECKVDYRVAQEGVHFVAPHMTKRKISANQLDFEKCLSTGGLQLESFSEGFAAKVRTLDMGSFVITLDGYQDDYIKKLMIVMWRCRGDAMNCLVTKIEMDGLKSKLRSIFGGDEKAEPKNEAEKPEETTVEGE